MINLIATIMNLVILLRLARLSTSLVASLQLITAAVIWTIAVYGTQNGMTPRTISSMVSFSGGALANVISVIILIIETVMMRHQK